MTSMTFNRWMDVYKPIESSPQNIFFETWQEETDRIKKICMERGWDNSHIWTLLDEDGKTWITNGVRWVNRLNYIVTEKPFAPVDTNDYLEVKL